MYCVPCLLEWDGRFTPNCVKCKVPGAKGKPPDGKYTVVQFKEKNPGEGSPKPATPSPKPAKESLNGEAACKDVNDDVTDEEFIGNVSLHDLDVGNEQESVPMSVVNALVGKFESTLSKFGAIVEKLVTKADIVQDGGHHGGDGGKPQTVTPPALTTPPPTTNTPPAEEVPPPAAHHYSQNFSSIDPAFNEMPGAEYGQHFPPSSHLFPGRQFPGPQSAIFSGGYGSSPRYGSSHAGGYGYSPHFYGRPPWGPPPESGPYATPGRGQSPDMRSPTPGPPGGPAAGLQGQQFQSPHGRLPLHQQYNQYQQYLQPHHQLPFGPTSYGEHSHTGGCCGSRAETAMSKFDYRRYVPASERKKQLVIHTVEELWDFHNNLLRDMLQCGEDVTGFVEHMNYMSEMGRSGIYSVSALVAYDAVMLERANNWGALAFQGADTHLTNTKLGAGGMREGSSASPTGGRGRGGQQNKARSTYS